MSPDDPRQPLLDLLRNYLDSYSEEVAELTRYLNFVESNPDCFKRSLSIGHVTGSALVLDNACERVLLTHHRKLNKWLQPGGHADGDCDVARVAMKEAEEETGLASIGFYSADLLDVDIHVIPERKSEPEHSHYDCRFLLRSTGSDDYVISEESNDLAWVPIEKIADYTDEESILRMLRKTQTLLG
jgi:8-oxo-dGTP pyrophosphatase MutT (NUDIX family)